MLPFTPVFILDTGLANSEDPGDKMPHKTAFHQGLHCFLKSKQSSGTEIY